MIHKYPFNSQVGKDFITLVLNVHHSQIMQLNVLALYEQAGLHVEWQSKPT